MNSPTLNEKQRTIALPIDKWGTILIFGKNTAQDDLMNHSNAPIFSQMNKKYPISAVPYAWKRQINDMDTMDVFENYKEIHGKQASTLLYFH